MNTIFSVKRFKALFLLQTLGAMNDSLIRNAVVVFYTYFLVISWPSRETLVTLTMFCFVLPSLLFSSYAGKCADMFDKVKILKIVKFAEIIIVIVATILYYFKMYESLLIVLFALGLQSTFLGPIKYSVLPDYFKGGDVVLANGYMEFGTLFAILIGQMCGGWLMASNLGYVVCVIAIISAIYGFSQCFKISSSLPVNTKVKFHKFFLIDMWHTYKLVAKNQNSKINIHAVAWFWFLGSIYTTQFALFALEYIGADGHLFSFIVSVYIVGVGLGSFICAKISKKHGVKRDFVVLSGIGMSIATLMLVFQNQVYIPLHVQSDIEILIDNKIDLLNMAIISICSGFYSVTCYTDLQLNANTENRSQTIAMANFFSAAYIVLASIIISLLVIKFDIWYIILFTAIANLGFCLWYALKKPKDTHMVLE